MAAYVPDAGDIIWLEFSPQAGHEQAGHRPAVVLSPASYNRIGLLLCCPLTTRRKGYPFEVAIDNDRQSAVLADQVKSLDWRARGAKRKGRVSESELTDIRAKARALIGK
ncbi:endoribonuclease [Acetobacter nitrogenifigens DSM 23921 = NBRC 105050]|uniref:Toxin n=1 Tax=Acetobacter nitrogenifigens DSM 23921 = NBRC 105050 TaxID=1120919 RepID=A0A511XFB6_9PROT|nr:endoribonuclease MazF [Acetobacter nitrogenifigens]GBQ96511.1 endoribonuclease [Acetobacter nitrogenifigens DSM 23921 = NBRC 105050]GEN61652.1 toxin [Acetobacter nitrogenifigens DSM 23921 = NBRC 105050]